MISGDVVVVGGGVVGCACALELARAGARVTVVERDGIASHASGFSLGGLFPTQGAGIPGPVEKPARDAYEAHARMYPALVDETGIDYELRQVDQVTLAADDQGRRGIDAAYAWQRARGFEAEVLSDADLRRLEPALAPGFAGGLLQRAGMELDSYKLTLAMGRALERLGGRIVTAEVVGIDVRAGRVAGVETRSGEKIAAGSVVIATGPWAGMPPRTDLKSPHSVGLPALPVKPYKGEIIRLRMTGVGFSHRFTLDGRSVGRKGGGLLWVGATEEDRGFDEEPTDAARDYLITGATRISPALASAELVEHTACLRPLASDGLPIVGPLRAAEGLYAAAGAGKKGVLLSVEIAKWVASLVLGNSGPGVPAELSAARLGI